MLDKVFQFFKTSYEAFKAAKTLEKINTIFTIVTAVTGVKGFLQARQMLSKGQDIMANKTAAGGKIPVIYGTRRVGAQIVYMDTAQNRSKDLFVVYAISVGECSEIVPSSIEIDGNSILDGNIYKGGGYVGSDRNGQTGYSHHQPLNTASQVGDNQYSNAGTLGTNPALRYSFVFNLHHGASSQTADPMLRASIPTEWTTNHKLNGICYLACSFDYDKKGMYKGVPQITVQVKGKKVYDPRESDHTFGDPSTYEWSSNPALCFLDYITNDQYGKGLAESQINMTAIGTAADKCNTKVDQPYYNGSYQDVTWSGDSGDDFIVIDDNADWWQNKVDEFIDIRDVNDTSIFSDDITIKGSTRYEFYDATQENRLYIDGTLSSTYTNEAGSAKAQVKRFHCNGYIDTNKNVMDNAKELLANMRGILNYVNGKYELQIEDTGTSTFSITDDHIIADAGISVDYGNKDKKANKVVIEFFNANKKYELDTATVLHDASPEYYSDDGEVLEVKAEFPYVTDPYIAYNMGKAILTRSRNQTTMQFLGTPEMYKLNVGDIVDLTYSGLGFSAKPCRVEALELQANGLVSVSLIVYFDVYTWEVPAQESVEILAKIPTIGALKPPQANSIVFTDTDASSINRPTLTWTEPTDFPVRQYRVDVVDSSANNVFSKIVDTPSVDLAFLPKAANYEASITAFNGVGIESNASTKTFTIADDPVKTTEVEMNGVTLSTVESYGTVTGKSGNWVKFLNKTNFGEVVEFQNGLLVDGGNAQFENAATFVDGFTGQGTFNISQGSIQFGSYTPSTTTNNLYNVGGSLYWNGQALGTGTGDITAVVAGTNLNGGGTSGSVTLNLDSTITGDHTFSNNVIISGDLTVNGTTTTVNTNDLNVKDKNITLNYSTGDSSASANGAGITIQDAVNSTTDATLTWNTSNDSFNFSHNLNFADNVKAQFGASNNLQIYRDSSNSHIKNTGTGSLYIAAEGTGDLFLRGEDDIFIQPQGGENGIVVQGNGAVTLYHNNSPKIATTATGVEITGNLDSPQISINDYISHNGDSNTYFGFDSADTFALVTGGTTAISADANATYLRYQGSSKLATTSQGINVTSLIQAEKIQLNASGSDNPQIQLNNNDFATFDWLVSQGDNGKFHVTVSGTSGAEMELSSDGSDYTNAILTVGGQKVLTQTAGINLTGNLGFNDNVKALFGTNHDLQIYHDGSNSYIKDTGTGNLKILGSSWTIIEGATSGTWGIAHLDGAQTNLYHNGNLKLATTSTGIDVTGVITTDGLTTSADINFGDDDKALFGAGNDLKIYHSANNQSYIHEVGSGDLNILATNLKLQDAGGSTKVLVNSSGMDVTGTVTTDGLTSSGNLDIVSSYPRINLTDTGENPDYSIINANGVFNIYDVQNNSNRLSISSTGNATFAGTVTSDGLTVDGADVFFNSGWIKSNSSLRIDIDNDNNQTDRAFFISHGNASRDIFKASENGDISFYDDTGSTQGFFWDASAESLCLGNTNASASLDIRKDSGFALRAENNLGQYFRVAAGGNTEIGGTLDVTGTISSGSVTAGSSGNSAFLRAYYGSDYMTLQGYGLEMNRTTSYIRPTTDGNKTLYIGGANASLDWAAIHFRSLLGLYMTGTQFLTTDRNLVNIGTISSGAITATGLTVSTASSVPTFDIITTHPSGIPILNLKGAASAQVRYQDENGNNQSRIDFNDAGAFNFIDATDGSSHLLINSSGNATFNGTITSTGLEIDNEYTLPSSSGSAGQVLKYPATGSQVIWADDDTQGTTINNNANNRIITGSGTANTLNAEADFTYDGSKIITTSNSIQGTSLTLANTNGGGGREFTFISNSTGNFYIYDDTADATRFEMNSSGYAKFHSGINVVSDISINATQVITSSRNLVNIGTISSGAITSSGTLTIENTYPRINLFDTNNNPDWSIINNNGNLRFWDNTNGAERFSLSTTGNATFAGTVTADGLTVSDGTNGIIQVGALNTRKIAGGADYGGIRYYSDNDHILYTNNVQRLAINSGGDISFYDDTGTTQGLFWDASAENLFVGGTTTTNAQGWGRQISSINSGTNGAALTLKDSNGEYQLASYANNFYLSQGANTRFFINSSGNVGVGTNSPSHNLTIEGTTSSTTTRVKTTTGNAIYRVSTNNSDFAIIGQGGSNRLDVYDNNGSATRLSLDASGNFLVGKTSSSTGVAGARFSANGFANVTRDGGECINFNRLTSVGTIIDLRKDSTTVGEIGVEFTDNIYVGGNSSHAKLGFGSTSVVPSNGNSTVSDADTDLGASNNRFKDLHLSGTATVGKITGTLGQGSQLYGLQLTRSSSGTTTPDLWGDNGTLVLGTSSSTEALSFTGANSTFHGTISSSAITASGLSYLTQVDSSEFRNTTRVSNATTPANTAGWFKIAKVVRGGGRILLSFTGGSYTPDTFVIDYYKNWSTVGSLFLKKYQGTGFITKARIRQDSADSIYYVEIYCASNSNGLSFKVYHQRLQGYASDANTVYGGSLSAGATSGTDIVSEQSFISKGIWTEGIEADYYYGDVNIHSGSLKLNNTTVIDSSRNLTNIGTISSGAITSSGNVAMGSGNATGKFAVLSSGVHPSFDFYNNGTSYFNGATTIDDNLTLNGTLAGKSDNTTEIGTYTTGAIKRIRMAQGGELHFGDTTTSSPLGITEGEWNNFGDQDRMSIYYRSSLKLFSGTSEKFAFDTSGNLNVTGSTSTGDLKIGSTTVINGARSLTNIASANVAGNITIDYTGNGTNDAGLFVQNDASDWGIRVHKTGTTTHGMQIDADGDYVFRTVNSSGVEKFRIDGDGDIETVRNITSSGDIYVGGSYNKQIRVRHIEGKDSTSDSYGGLYLNYNSTYNIQIGHSGNQNDLFLYGALRTGGTVRLDNSGNLSNIGTISSGVTTITSTGTIGGSTPSNGYLKITDGTNTLAFDANEIHTTDNLYLNAEDGTIYLRGNNGGAVTLKNGGITFMSTTRDLQNIGTISSGAITANSSGTNTVTIDGTGTKTLRSYHDSGGVGWATGSGTSYTNLLYLDDNNDRIRIYTEQAERLRINASGIDARTGGFSINATTVIDASRQFTTNSRLTFGYNSHYFEAGTNAVSFKSGSGTNYLTINNTGLTTSGSITATGNGVFNFNKTETYNPVITANDSESDSGQIIAVQIGGTTKGNIGISSATGNDMYIASGTTSSAGVGLRFLSYQSAQYASPCRGDGSTLDNVMDLGSIGTRFDDIYATNGTIQTSDRNEKQDIQALTDAEQRVATACKGLIRRFRWQDAVEEKGDDARYHFGVIAQDLQDAFEAEGLDAGDYGMFISSTWTDDGGNEKTRLGVRYNELLAFIITTI